MFKHFLITRYNLYIASWKITKNNVKINNLWLDHRYELFSKYCYPSVINQSNQNFIWLIFLNSDTQEDYKKKISELVQKHLNIRIVQANAVASPAILITVKNLLRIKFL